MLVTLDSHGQVVSFHLENNRYVAIRRKGVRIVAIAFSPVRRSELFMSLADGDIECMDIATKATVGTLRGHVHAARTLACHPSQPLLLSCAGDAAILWTTGHDFSRARAMPAGPTRLLQDALFLPSRDGLLTCVESSITLWRLDSFEASAELKLPPAHGSALRLRTCGVTTDSSTCVGCGVGGWLAVWSLRTAALARMIMLPEAFGSISQLTPLPPPTPTKRKRAYPFLIGCSDGVLRVVDAATAVVTYAMPAPKKLLSAAVDPSLHTLAGVCPDGSVSVHRLDGVLAPRGEPTQLRAVSAGPLVEEDEAVTARGKGGYGGHSFARSPTSVTAATQSMRVPSALVGGGGGRSSEGDASWANVCLALPLSLGCPRTGIAK